MYETHWTGLSRPSWEREMDLQLSRQQILLHWAGTPNQHRQTNRLYRQMRIGVAQRELSRANGERFLAPGYGCVPNADWLRHCSATVLPNGARFWCKADDGLWWLEEISARTSIDGEYWYVVEMTRDRSSFRSLRLTTRLRQEVFKVPGAVNSVGVDQLHAGSKVT